jgi:hypothetical protein
LSGFEKKFDLQKKKAISEIILRLAHIRGKEKQSTLIVLIYGYLNLVYGGAPSAQANFALPVFGWFLLAPANSALWW